MVCTPTHDLTELDFVLSLTTRTKEIGECRGPLLELALWNWRALTLEHIFDSPAASDILWAGMQEQDISVTKGFRPAKKFGSGIIHFSLCAAHWVDLACLCWMRSRQHRDPEFKAEADQLLRDTCEAAGWDEKEIGNMFAWQRARLT
jgi:hypothetical protein